MANLSNLAPITTAATALGNLILVSPQSTLGYQPQNRPAINGQTQPLPPPLLFHYEGEQSATMVSDITDHYVETNIAVQDQIALKSELISVRGFIGELNDVVPPILVPLQIAASKLTVLEAYTPQLTATALLAYNEAVFLYDTAAQAASSAVASWSSINGSGGENVIGSNGLDTGAFNPKTGQISNNQNKQQVFFQQFYGYWRAKTLFTVQTPWAVFQNMAIQSLKAIQDAETRVISDFEITFKAIRLANSIITNTDPTQDFQSRAAILANPLTSQDTSQPIQTSVDVPQVVASIG